MLLHSFFMANWSGTGYGGIAVPCSANRTLLRRLQRKHTEQSYRLMKAKLLSIVKPMPIAAFSEDLEEFRHTLYANRDDCNRCLWWGIWIPIPKNPITIFTTEVKEAGSTAEADPKPCRLEEKDKAVDPSSISTTVVKEDCCSAEPDPICCQLDVVGNAVDELLELSLCQPPCTIGQGNIKIDVSRSLWEYTGTDSIFAADAYISRGDERIWDDYKDCFKRTRAPAAEVPEAALHNSVSFLPVPSQCSTDESTGECKSQ